MGTEYIAKAYEMAAVISREFPDGESRDLLFEVLSEVFRVDIKIDGGEGFSGTAHSRIRREIEALLERNKGPYYRELFYEILEENL